MRLTSYIPPCLFLIYGIDALPRLHDQNQERATRNCKELDIPVTVSTENINIPIPAPNNNIAITDLILQTYTLLSKASSASSSSSSPLTPKPNLISGTYRIGATYCEPPSSYSQEDQQQSSPASSLQILTHGVGFDRSYWDFPLHSGNYSYVDAALAEGYSTLNWDRLGLGGSTDLENLDPVQDLQTPLHVAILHELTAMARDGRLPLENSSSSCSFEKVIHVGHSYGSFLSYGLSVLDPSSSDALVLTGFAHDSASQATLAPLALHPVTAGSIPPTSKYDVPGYWAEGDPTAAQMTLFAPGQFDPEMLGAVFEASQPFTMGEFLTLNIATKKTSQVTCPVMVVTGEHDFPICGGNCYSTGSSSNSSSSSSSIVEKAKEYFPHATNFRAEVVQGAGHALNLEYTHEATYGKIMDFMAENGLA